MVDELRKTYHDRYYAIERVTKETIQSTEYAKFTSEVRSQLEKEFADKSESLLKEISAERELNLERQKQFDLLAEELAKEKELVKAAMQEARDETHRAHQMIADFEEKNTAHLAMMERMSKEDCVVFVGPAEGIGNPAGTMERLAQGEIQGGSACLCAWCGAFLSH